MKSKYVRSLKFAESPHKYIEAVSKLGCSLEESTLFNALYKFYISLNGFFSQAVDPRDFDVVKLLGLKYQLQYTLLKYVTQIFELGNRAADMLLMDRRRRSYTILFNTSLPLYAFLRKGQGWNIALRRKDMPAKQSYHGYDVITHFEFPDTPSYSRLLNTIKILQRKHSP